MEATKVDQVKENSDLKPTSMLATGVSQVKTSQTRPVERSEYSGKGRMVKMMNLLKMVLMTTMSKASSIFASTRKESTIILMMTMMTKVSNLMTGPGSTWPAVSCCDAVETNLDYIFLSSIFPCSQKKSKD